MPRLAIYASTVADGNMKAPDYSHEPVMSARASFLQANTIDIASTTLVQTTYGSDDFCRYYTVDTSHQGDGMTRATSLEADALITSIPGQALFLPLADCIGAVIYDTAQNILMLSHLGRHNLEQFGGTKCIEYLMDTHGSHPDDITAWLSPAAGNEEYPLFAFNHRSLHEVATEQLMVAGIPRANITVSPINSASDSAYFSHSQFLQGKRADDGRFAVAAVLSS